MVIRFFIREQKIENNHMCNKHGHTALDIYLCWITPLIVRTLHSLLKCDRFANVRLCVQSRQVVWVVHLPLTGFHFLGLSEFGRSLSPLIHGCDHFSWCLLRVLGWLWSNISLLLNDVLLEYTIHYTDLLIFITAFKTFKTIYRNEALTDSRS
jgi:hypothetical protein